MISVFEIIAAIFEAAPDSEFYQAINGQLYTEEAPEDAEPPYCVVTDSGSDNTQGFCHTVADHSLVFALYDRRQSPENILQIGQYLRDLFEYKRANGKPLSLIGMRLDAQQLNRYPDIDVWEYLNSYTATVDNEQ